MNLKGRDLEEEDPMDKRGWVAVVAAILVAGVVAVASVVVAAGNDDAAASQTASNTITVTSTASIGTAPDEAVVSLGIHSSAATAPAALDANAKAQNAVIAALTAAGITKKDLETTNVGLSSRVTDRGKPTEATVYTATTQIQATVHDLKSVGSVIQTGVQAGANQIQGVKFQVSNEAKARSEALSAAVKGARSKADVMAGAAGTSVEGVVDIQEQAARTQPYYARDLALQSYTTAAPIAAPSIVAPHSLPTQVTVVVTWELDG
jgi:uncharacterized protein YggE